MKIEAKAKTNDVLEAAKRARKLLDSAVSDIPNSILQGGALIAPAFGISEALEAGDKGRFRKEGPRERILASVLAKLKKSKVYDIKGREIPHEARRIFRKELIAPNIRASTIGALVGILYGKDVGKHWQRSLEAQGQKLLIDRQTLLALIGSALGANTSTAMYNMVNKGKVK